VPDADSLAGFGFAFASYATWGILAVYLKALAHVPPAEVVLHRALWSLPVAAVVLVALGRTADIRAALRSPRTLAMAAVTSGLISLNWGLFIWAVGNGQTVEAALGYYINPLVNVALATLFLGERPNRAQVVAIALAAIAVMILTVAAGGLPWISLGLPATFAAYAFLRKTLPIGPSQGFFLEVLIMSGPAIAAMIWLALAGEGHFTPDRPADMLLLLGCGPLTALPLIMFAFGAKKLRFTTIGLMQYITPTMTFLAAIYLFGEPFDGVRASAFVLIWVALAIYTWSLFRTRQTPPPEAAP
jgi:chloramphenicol-sensitive protein RarD